MNDLWAPETTLAEHGEAHLRKLCRAAGLRDPAPPLEVFRTMAAGWGGATLGEEAFVSFLTTDRGPFEPSMMITRAGASLRWALQVCPDGDLEAGFQLFLEQCDAIHRRYDADIDRVLELSDLVAPGSADAEGQQCVAAAVGDGRPPAFKAYFWQRDDHEELAYQQAFGAQVLRVMERLGLGRQAETLGVFGPEEPLVGFSIDLVPGKDRRFKVYVDQRGEDLVARVERTAALARHSTPGELGAFLREISGHESDAALDGADLLTINTLHFTDEAARPARVTCGLSVDRALLIGADDEVLTEAQLRDRVAGFMERLGLPVGPYGEALEALARVPLEYEHLIHDVLSFQRIGAEPVLTAYLNTRPYMFLEP